jgi:hypothetical protein
MNPQPSQNQKPPETMGFQRPLNILLLVVLFIATCFLWSLRSAAILLGLLVVATLISVWARRKKV